MKMMLANELLVSAHQIIDGFNDTPVYEFIINDSLAVIDCLRVADVASNLLEPVPDFHAILSGELFELSHVRVNPRLDNSHMVKVMMSALQSIGVNINNPPHPSSMAMCYKPLGEITDNVRFHFNEMGQLTFLCPSSRPRLVSVTTNPEPASPQR